MAHCGGFPIQSRAGEATMKAQLARGPMEPGPKAGHFVALSLGRLVTANVIAFTLVVLFALAASAAAKNKTKPDKLDQANWMQAESSNTIAGYVQYLRQSRLGPSAHEAEAKERLTALLRTDLASMKEVAVTTQATDAAGQKLMSAGLDKLILQALQAQGYRVVADSPNQITVSVSQKRFLSGTSDAYWHFCSLESVSVTFSKRGIGPIFRDNVPGGPIKTDGELHQFPSIRVKPLSTDQRPFTYINPDTGEAWGAGVEFVAGSNDPAVIAADKRAFQAYDWAAIVDSDADLEGIRGAFARLPPLAINDSTEWVY